MTTRAGCVVEITDNCGSYLCGGNFGNIHLPELQGASKRTAETFCGRTTGQSHEAETGRSRELREAFPLRVKGIEMKNI